MYRASVSVFTNLDFSSYETLDLNLSELVRSCFALPFTERNPSELSIPDTNESITKAVEEDVSISGTLKISTVRSNFKVVIKIIQKCYSGMLGFPDQVIQPHKQILAALMKSDSFNWESAYLVYLFAEKSSVKT